MRREKKSHEKDFMVELEVSGAILTREKALNENQAISKAESRDYINHPENLEDIDVDISPSDVWEIKEENK